MKSYSILIIDDDESAHDVLGDYLTLAGFSVLHARDGAAGLMMLEEHKPDLALLDVNMPVLDGFRTMEMISKNSELRDIPVLFLTSLDRYNLKVKGLELGAEDYIIKPYNKAELLARVKATLRRSKRYTGTVNAIEGNFSAIGLAELLQTFDIGRKTACIGMQDIGGQLCVEEGLIVYVSFRDMTGFEAVSRIFFLEKGHFSVHLIPMPDETKRTALPIQKTIFNAVTYIDELKKILEDLCLNDDFIEIRDTGIEEIYRFRTLSPIKAKELICVMKGDLKENALKIAEALRQNMLVLVK